jgi:outer membrane protein, heavy metal efflux system
VKTRIFLLILLGISSCSQAAPHPTEPSALPEVPEWKPAPPPDSPSSFAGLDALLAEAMRSNPGLAEKQSAWEAADAGIIQARGYPDPTLGFGGFITPLETRNGPTTARLSLQQRLPYPSELDALEDGAAALAAATYSRWQSETLRVREQLALAWWELAFLHHATALVDQTLKLVITTEKSLHSQLEVGRATFGDVIRIEVERARLEDQLRNYRDQLNPLRFKIRSLVGLSGEEAAWPLPKLTPNVVPEAPEVFPTQPFPRHPDLMEVAYLQVAAQAELTVAKTDSWPDLIVGLEWTAVGTGPGTAPDSGQDGLAASINFSVPLHRARYAGARREAKERMNQYLHAQQNRELSLSAGLSRSAFDFRDAERRIVLYRDQLEPKTEQSFEAALSALETGGESFETLLDTLRLLLEFQVASARAEADRAQALAQLERLFGQSLIPDPDQSHQNTTQLPKEEGK